MAKAKKKPAKATQAGKNRKVARSSKTGKFVKKGYAKTHPATTQVERVKSGSKKIKKKIKVRRLKGAAGSHGPGDAW